MRGIGWLGGALLFSLAAQAQTGPAQTDFIQLKEAPAPAPETADIVVKAGPPPKVSEVTKQARAVTRSDDILREPMSRFQYGVCPGIMGLPREAGELIVDRIRYNAERTGVPVAKDGCQLNILVVVTPDSRAAVDLLMRKRGYLFQHMSSLDMRALQNDRGPVHAWTNIERRGRHGEAYSGAMEYNGTRVPVLQEPMAHSKIYLTTRLEISSAVVLLDVAAIDGLTINQIADYVTMRAFVDTKVPDGVPATSTVLSLFNDDAPHAQELTSFDLAYLRAAYAGEANLPVFGKLVSAARAVRDAAPARDQSRAGSE